MLYIKYSKKSIKNFRKFSTNKDRKTSDVCIIGSGPIGGLYAKHLVESGRSVIILEAGEQKSFHPGEHMKNAYIYQRELNSFSSIIQGTLQKGSIPPVDADLLTQDPSSWNVPSSNIRDKIPFIKNGQNPNQIANFNLSGWGNTYCVGGMATHWTAHIPRQHPTVERYNSDVYTSKEWDRLYTENEKILRKSFDIPFHDQGKTPTLRHTLVLETMSDILNSRLEEGYKVQTMGLAGERKNKKRVHWTGTYEIIKPILDNKLFRIERNALATELIHKGGKVTSVKYRDLSTGERNKEVFADTFIVAANAILTPQILWNSKIRPNALGKYLCEQPMTFCQIVLNQKLVEKYLEDERFKREAEEYHKKNPEDPLHIPMSSPEPQVWVPVTKNRPWHAQIHRDAFSYGKILDSIDSRLIVDFRYFGMTEPSKDRKVDFTDKYKDIMGMPQPTFTFDHTPDERQVYHKMFEEMITAANALGGFVKGSEPQFMDPGLALHVTGTVRIGTDTETSVCDENSRVHGFANLYVGGNGVIPTKNASNPTLTSMCFAQKSCESIIQNKVNN